MKEAFYFPHDNNAHNDPKLMQVFMKTWLAGIWLYWILIELMHQQESWKIKKSQYDDYIRWYSSHENKWEAFVEQLLNIYISSELFCLDNDWFIFSKRVIENKKYREELSEKRSNAWKKSALARKKWTSVEQKWTSVEQGKERKGKEIKGNNTETLVASQPNEYLLSMEYLKSFSIETEIPEYAEKYREEWIKFCIYWGEKWKTGKIRAEWQKTFEIKKRFITWIGRKKEQYQKENIPKSSSLDITL